MATPRRLPHTHELVLNTREADSSIRHRFRQVSSVSMTPWLHSQLKGCMAFVAKIRRKALVDISFARTRVPTNLQ